MIKQSLLIFIMAPACGTASQSSDVRSINSKEVAEDHPLRNKIVSLSVVGADVEGNSTSSTTQHCTGYLLNERYVLTAAHCADDDFKNAQNRFVIVSRTGTDKAESVWNSHGQYDSINESVDLRDGSVLATGIYYHPATKFFTYQKKLIDALENKTQAQPDANVTKLVKENEQRWIHAPISLNDLLIIQIPELPRDSESGFAHVDLSNKRVKAGSELLVMGFGVNTITDEDEEFASVEMDGTLRAVTYVTTDRSNEGELTGRPIKNDALICGGDSGGPAFVKKRDAIQLVGITSRSGFDCENKARRLLKEAVWTEIQSAAEWIQCVLDGPETRPGCPVADLINITDGK